MHKKTDQPKLICFMAPPVGLEPTTCGLTVRRSTDGAKGAYVLALPIFPGRHQPSIVGAYELNFCVRDGNRWTLIAINTNYYVSFAHTFQSRINNVKIHSVRKLSF